MNRKNIFWIICFILLIIILNLFSKSVENKVLESRLKIVHIENEIDEEFISEYKNTEGFPQGKWTVDGIEKSTMDFINELKVGSSWGAIENITEKEYDRIKGLTQYMGVSVHNEIDYGCFYSKSANKVLKETKFNAPYYHQGLFGKELWGDVISGTYIANPDSNSTFNQNGCHIYALAYALSATSGKLINPPETLVLGWYSGFWNNGMGPTENVENLKKYLGVNACVVSDDRENAKKEIDNIIDNNGVVIVYLTKPFSFGNYHWVCITDRVNDNGVDKYKIWTSTNIHQMFQLYTFDYLYSKRVFEDWVRIGIIP